MARVGRIAGCLLVKSEGVYALIGYPKEPCAWEEHGFVPPSEMQHWEAPYCRLQTLEGIAPDLSEVFLEVELEGEPLRDALMDRLLVARNGSVSERLWRLIVGADDEGNVAPGPRKARYLTETPQAIWNVVKDAVLRCS